MNRFLFILLIGCVTCRVAVAQTGSDEAIHELALQALSYPGAPPGDVELLPGALPDSLTVPFDMPEGSRLLGSLVRSYETAIFIKTGASAEEVARFYNDLFLRAGWQAQTWPRWGFASPVDVYPNLYCSPTDGKWLNVMTSYLPGKSIDVRLTISGSMGERTPCENAGTVERPQDFPPMPLITLPGEARVTSIGSGSGLTTMDEVQASAVFEVDESLSLVMQHISAQLEEAGWEQTEEGGLDPVLWCTYAMNDDQGRAWRGQLVLTHLPTQDRISAFVLASKVN